MDLNFLEMKISQIAYHEIRTWIMKYLGTVTIAKDKYKEKFHEYFIRKNEQ